MRTVPTFAGDVDAADLGVTLMHEHVFVLTPELQEAFPGFMGFDEQTAVADAQQRLTALKQSGVDTIVDLTAPGLGRNVKRVARAVEGTGLNVIACTGYYTYDKLPHPMAYIGPGKVVTDDPQDDLLVSLFVNDIVQGIQGTAIKAGILKCCTDEPGLTPDVERVLRAVARTHLRTDVPIATHTHAPTRRGLDQQRVFAAEGVDLGRVVIGHSNEASSVDYLVEVIDNGSYIGYDRCGIDLTVDLDTQVQMLAELCERGYADRVVLSHDRHCTSDWFPENRVRELLPQWDHDYIRGDMVAALKERGVTDRQVTTMLVDNPRAIFGATS
ncbi:MAG TPA: phosphotriesterase-related protein [Mycobacteriales bacterium]|jgi:phosphotriesterase-related protein|nr:phosphotriesterase-related protein [Mycobacteriales bacterium]